MAGTKGHSGGAREGAGRPPMRFDPGFSELMEAGFPHDARLRVVEQMAGMAQEGHVRAAQFLFNYCYGRPAVRYEDDEPPAQYPSEIQYDRKLWQMTLAYHMRANNRLGVDALMLMDFPWIDEERERWEWKGTCLEGPARAPVAYEYVRTISPNSVSPAEWEAFLEFRKVNSELLNMDLSELTEYYFRLIGKSEKEEEPPGIRPGRLPLQALLTELTARESALKTQAGQNSTTTNAPPAPSPAATTIPATAPGRAAEDDDDDDDHHDDDGPGWQHDDDPSEGAFHDSEGASYKAHEDTGPSHKMGCSRDETPHHAGSGDATPHITSPPARDPPSRSSALTPPATPPPEPSPPTDPAFSSRHGRSGLPPAWIENLEENQRMRIHREARCSGGYKYPIRQ